MFWNRYNLHVYKTDLFYFICIDYNDSNDIGRFQIVDLTRITFSYSFTIHGYILYEHYPRVRKTLSTIVTNLESL